METRLQTVLRAARLALLTSIVAFAVVLGTTALGIASDWLALPALILIGWMALSAFACLLLQIALFLRSRRQGGPDGA